MVEPSRNTTAALAALGAGLLCVLGALLPWAVVDETLRGGVVLRDVVRGGETPDGRLTFAFAWVAVVMVVSMLLPPRAGFWMGAGLLGMFVSTLILAGLNLGDLDGFAADPADSSVGVGVGLTLALLSSLIGLGAAGWMIATDRDRWWALLGRPPETVAPIAEPYLEETEDFAEDDGTGWDQRRVYPAAGALVAALLATIGSFGPWVTETILLGRSVALTTTLSGPETNGGRVVLVLLVMAAGTLLLRLLRPVTRSWSLWLALAYLALVALVAGLNWADAEGLVTDEGARVERIIAPGWGLVLATIAAIAGVGCCVWGIIEAFFAPEPPAPAPTSESSPPPPGSTPLFRP